MSCCGENDLKERKDKEWWEDAGVASNENLFQALVVLSCMGIIVFMSITMWFFGG